MEKHKCIDVVRKQIMAADETVEYVRFNLDNISNINSKHTEFKTGQRVFVGIKGRKKEEKSFVAHDYCPFCGIKYK